MKNHVRGRHLISRICATLIVGGFALLCVFPFVWMLSTSFKYEINVMEFPIRLIPNPFNPNNYSKVWNDSNFPLYYLNSFKVTLLTLAGDLILTTTAAYSFARLRFRGKDVIFMLYLATMMVPIQATLLPKYIYFSQIGLTNTHGALILPGIFNVFGTFLMRNFFEAIPFEITEAAHIDGAGHFRTFWQIVLPLVKGGIMTEVLLQFTWVWNDYMHPLIFLSSEQKLTLTVGLQRFQESVSTNYALIMAGATVSLIPIIIVFLFTQKYFIQSFATVGIKG